MTALVGSTPASSVNLGPLQPTKNESQQIQSRIVDNGIMSERTYFGKDLEAMTFANNCHKWILEKFTPYLGKNIAEVGAGMGNFSEFLLATDIEQLCCFEPSTNMFESLQQKFSGNSRVHTHNDFFEEHSKNHSEHFDSICYVNVLEHIKDDKSALSHAYTSLVSGGYLLIFVPALQFLYSRMDQQVGHFRRYSKNQLSDVVSSAGFPLEK